MTDRLQRSGPIGAGAAGLAATQAFRLASPEPSLNALPRAGPQLGQRARKLNVAQRKRSRRQLRRVAVAAKVGAAVRLAAHGLGHGLG